jgi:hypothetical protein
MYSWNIFRIGGDILHAASIMILLLKILAQKSCQGSSLIFDGFFHCFVLDEIFIFKMDQIP